MTEPAYLHAHSEYSLLDGSMTVEDYVAALDRAGYGAGALTDTHNLFGAFKFDQAARARSIQPLIGVDLYVKQRDTGGWQSRSEPDRLLVYVRNEEGFARLSSLISESYRHRHERGLWVPLDQLAGGSDNLLVLGPPGPGEDERSPSFNPEQFESSLGTFKSTFGSSAGVEIPVYSSNQSEVAARIKLARKHGLTPVPTHPTFFENRDDFQTLRLRRAVQTNTTLDDLRGLPDRRRSQWLMEPRQLREHLPDGEEELLAEAADWIRECEFEFDTTTVRLPEYDFVDTPSDELLRKLCEKGRRKKPLDANPEEVDERLDHELDIIERMGFIDYFLIVADVVNWAKNNDIRVGPGRGSAAGSLVAYLTDITDVDPFEYDLIFERFLNPDRNEMPDIDIDFADHQRDRVIRYIRQRFGEDSVSQIITFGRMKARNSIRDVGRIRNEPQHRIDELAEAVPSYEDRTLGELLDGESELSRRADNAPGVAEWLQQARRLEGFVRNPSIHAAGLLIVDGQLTDQMPLYYPDETDPEAASQFDMYDVEELGFLKLDVLGLTTLTLIDRTLEQIPEHQRPDLEAIPDNDETALNLFGNQSLEGVFQFEARGGRELAHAMKPDTKREVVDCIALNRPGPAQYREDYLRRRAGKDDVSYPHPDLKPVLEDTYGLIIYQEQVMAIARIIGDFTWSEADIMRKAMGKKKQTLMDELRKNFLEGATGKGYDRDFAEELFADLAKFAEYGFNRSHSAAYGEITYRTAYLKAHFPAEFYAAFLTLKSKDRDRISIIEEAMESDDIALLQPDVNFSDAEFVTEDDGVRYGLRAIKHVGSGLARSIVSRRADGPYEDIDDFLGRIPPEQIHKGTLQSMAAAGCFDSIHGARGPLIENAESLLQEGERAFDERNSGQEQLFGEQHRDRQSVPGEESWSSQRLRRAQKEATGVVF